MRHFAFATPNGRTRRSVATLDSSRSPMSPACIVVREDEGGSEGILLVRYSRDGQFAGDTWHEMVEHAEQQMDFEFFERTAWEPVPANVSDLDAFVKEVLKSRP